MLGFLLRRLAASLILLVLVLTATFILMHLAPGDPTNREASRLTAEQRENLRRIYGLDRPLPEQYLRWMTSVALRGDFGISWSQQRPVADALKAALPPTLLLAFAALFVEYAIALPLGVAVARRPGSALDHGVRVVSLIIFSQPVFWLALMAILLFSQVWPVLPSSLMRSLGYEQMSPGERLLDLLRHLALPALVLGVWASGATLRLVRGSLLEVMSRDYIRTARAKGLSERRVVWVHGMRTALAPILQIFAVSLVGLLNGSLVAEVIFSWPGMGRLAFEAVLARDYPVVLATTALAAVFVLAANFLADVIHALADPRVRE
ncbi:MAG TPA: ABC transporter permease [Thermoanaerobaculia bacterium]|nr:ABC transporter permease [Thermoanaerobaculia bacterium]